jgi:hypothetical protein
MGRNWSVLGSQISESMPLRTPWNLCRLSRTAGWPLTSPAYDGDTVVVSCEWNDASPIFCWP